MEVRYAKKELVESSGKILYTWGMIYNIYKATKISFDGDLWGLLLCIWWIARCYKIKEWYLSV